MAIFKRNIDSRTRNVMVNAVASGAMKVCTMMCSFIIVPITIDYLNPENYGVWMAITSILYWIAFCDIGLGNGMRNYMAEAIAKGNWNAARSYFSTALIYLSAIALAIGLIAAPLIYMCDLNTLLNSQSLSSEMLINAVTVAIVFSLMQFVVKCVGMVYVALQKYAINDLITFLGSLTSVTIIYLLTKTTDGNLLYVVFAFTATPVLFFILAAIPLLNKYPELKPNFRYLNADSAKKVVYKGFGFFIIQITSCLVIFGSANVFMSHYCGPEQVTVYNIAYKLFNTLVIGYTIVMSPLWNAYTDAATKGDYAWIKKAFKRSLYMWMLTVIGGVILLLISRDLYQLWIGDNVTVTFEVSLCVLAYICAFNFNNCVTYLINGLNKIRVQTITSVVFTAIYLIAIYMIKGRFGIIGISLSMAIAYILMALIHLYQCYLFINNKATGIWNK